MDSERKTQLLRYAEQWEKMAQGPVKDRGTFSKRECFFKAAELRRRAEMTVLDEPAARRQDAT